jgi:hypothetical protein
MKPSVLDLDSGVVCVSRWRMNCLVAPDEALCFALYVAGWSPVMLRGRTPMRSAGDVVSLMVCDQLVAKPTNQPTNQRSN